MNTKTIQKIQQAFLDATCNNLAVGALYLLLIRLLGHEVVWVDVVSSVLMSALVVWLIIRLILLLRGKAKLRRDSAERRFGSGWTVSGFFLLYALVFYLKGQTESAVIMLIVCGIALLGTVAGCVLARRAGAK